MPQMFRRRKDQVGFGTLEDFKDLLHRCVGYRRFNTIKRDFLNATYRKWKLGFNPSETWCLDHSIAKFILPRLKYFRKTHRAYPSCFKNPKYWEKELDKMIAAFEIISDEDAYFPFIHPSKKDKIVQTGLDSFRKYFTALWW